MLFNFLEEMVKNLAGKIIPPIQRYFTYFFIVIGILWLGGANYYYYAEECAKFKGCLITGLIFFALAAMTAASEYYMNKKKNIVTKDDSRDLIVKALPIMLPLVYKIFTRIILRPQMLKTLAVIGFIGTGLYYVRTRAKNKYDL
jgi:hypothetical protein